jgi:hypothetical protein
MDRHLSSGQPGAATLLVLPHSMRERQPNTDPRPYAWRHWLQALAINALHNQSVSPVQNPKGILDSASDLSRLALSCAGAVGAAALQAKRIRGAALDVFETEPLPISSPLWDLPNVFM